MWRCRKLADDPEETPLNRKAFFALEGGSLDCVGDLIRLLRSSDPIHPIVRERIAEALDGGTVGGARLVLEDHGIINKLYHGVHSRGRKLEIGEHVQSLIDAGEMTKDALRIVGREKNAGDAHCDAALTFYRKARVLADQWEKRPEFRSLDRQTILAMCAEHIGRSRRTSNPHSKRKPYRSST